VAYPTGPASLDAAADRVASFSGGLLLPFFFLGFGLSVDLEALPFDADTLRVGGALLAVATLTKILGPGLCARLTGMGWRDSLSLGVLLNARGLTELVVLGIGLQAGIIDQRMFAILTVITLLTTALPVPLLRLLGHTRPTRPTRPTPPPGPGPGPAAVAESGPGGSRSDTARHPCRPPVTRRRHLRETQLPTNQKNPGRSAGPPAAEKP
jgi:hypothetical protein